MLHDSFLRFALTFERTRAFHPLARHESCERGRELAQNWSGLSDLVCLVYLVEQDQLDERNNPDKQDKPDRENLSDSAILHN